MYKYMMSGLGMVRTVYFAVLYIGFKETWEERRGEWQRSLNSGKILLPINSVLNKNDGYGQEIK